MYRGCGWFIDAARCGSAYCYYDAPSHRAIDYGFRLALSLFSQEQVEPESAGQDASEAEADR